MSRNLTLHSYFERIFDQDVFWQDILQCKHELIHALWCTNYFMGTLFLNHLNHVQHFSTDAGPLHPSYYINPVFCLYCMGNVILLRKYQWNIMPKPYITQLSNFTFISTQRPFQFSNGIMFSVVTSKDQTLHCSPHNSNYLIRAKYKI